MIGQQNASRNNAIFALWAAKQHVEDFRQIVHRCQLNRGEIAKAIGIRKDCLRQDPTIKELLERLEQ